MKPSKVRKYVAVGMLSAVSYVLMLLDFPLPGFPGFLKVDFSDIPALIAAIIMGPVAGVLVELFKNLLDLITTGSETGVPVGHMANFMTGITFVLPAYFIYMKLRTKKGMTLALLTATVIAAFVMSILNYILFLPMYAYFLDLHLPANIIAKAILPFNLLKGIILSAVFMLIFAKMHHWMDKQQSLFKKA